MKKLLFQLLLLHVSVAFGQHKYLVPYRVGDLWGYADTNRHIVVTPKYQRADIFWNGYATVTKNDLFGYLNGKGKQVVAPRYELLSFTNDRAIVSKGGKTGMLNAKTGKQILPLAYINIFGIGYNTFIVTAANQHRGLFSAVGNQFLLAPEYEEITLDSLGNGVIYYTATKASGSTSFSITEDGHFTIRYPVKKTTAPVNQQPGKIGADSVEMISEVTEAETSPDNMYSAGPFSQNGKIGYHSETITDSVSVTDSLPAIFDAITPVPHSNKLLIVNKNGRHGVISIRNQVIVPLVYDSVAASDSSYVSGIYIVNSNKKYGLATADSLLLPCIYDDIKESHSSYEGFMLIQNHRQGAFIDDPQRYLRHIFIPAKYDYILGLNGMHAADFGPPATYSFGYAQVKFFAYVSKNNRRGFVDMKGNEFFRD